MNKVLYERGVLKNFSDKHKEHSSGSVLSKDVLKNFCKIGRKKTSLLESFFNKFAGGNLKSAEAVAGDL